MKELCRVAKEVRVYPLVTLEGKRSGHIDPVVAELQNFWMDISFGLKMTIKEIAIRNIQELPKGATWENTTHLNPLPESALLQFGLQPDLFQIDLQASSSSAEVHSLNFSETPFR